MPVVKIPREILRRIAPHDGLSKALADFVKCQQEGQPTPRIYKQSGIASDGSAFQPYLRLGLWHHHLHRKGDPLLVTQVVGGEIIGVALTTHASFFGDKMLWLQQNNEAIDWTLCGDIRTEVLAYTPPRADR
jgi:hypothetical protein